MTLLRSFKYHLAYRQGRRLLQRYLAVVKSLELDIPDAETVCRSLKRLRRRGKACARIARRLRDHHE